MRFERLKRLGSHDWYFQLGAVDGKQPFCILLRHFTGLGFRLTINLNSDKLIKMFGFCQKIFGV